MLSEHIQCPVWELHELVVLCETLLFVDFGKLTPSERRHCHMKRANYLSKGML